MFQLEGILGTIRSSTPVLSKWKWDSREVWWLVLSKWVSEWVSDNHSTVSFYDPMDCSLPGSSVHGILQARILEWVAISFSSVLSKALDGDPRHLICSQMPSNQTGHHFFSFYAVILENSNFALSKPWLCVSWLSMSSLGNCFGVDFVYCFVLGCAGSSLLLKGFL